MAHDPLGSVTIGPREIYDAVINLQSTVNRLVSHRDADVKVKDDHENRLRSLERSRWPLPSAAVLLALGSLVVAGLTYLTR